MSTIQDIIDLLGPVLQRVWPGILVALVLGYAGAVVLGNWGFLAGSGAGALIGTLLGDRLLGRRGKKPASLFDLKTILHVLGAFVIVVIGSMFIQAVVIIAVVSAIIAASALWLAG
jgi:hypothetical protein